MKCGQLSASRDYGLISIDSILGLVHIVRKDSFIQDIHRLSKRRKVAEKGFGLVKGWEADQFYVNRFYCFKAHDPISECRFPAFHENSSEEAS